MQRQLEAFEVVVPGSTANLGSGFDSVGLAVNRFLRMRVRPADHWEVVLFGESLKGLSSGRGNLIVRVMERACERKGVSLSPLRLEVESDIPLMRGLGSSAAAIVAGLTAANHLLGRPWSREELLQQAVEWEGHPDNVGAALYGGLIVASWDGNRAHLIPVSPPALHMVAAIPRVSLPTVEARRVLPRSLPHGEAVLGSSRANLLIAALLTENWEALRIGMNDRFHQPYRKALVPGLDEVLQNAHRHGALGAALSGAGPTVIAFTRDPDPVVRYMKQVFGEMSVPVEVMVLHPHPEGAYIRLTTDADRSTFVGNVKGATS